MKKFIFPVLAGLIVTSVSFYAGRQSVGTPPPHSPPPAPVVEKPKPTPLPAFISPPSRDPSAAIKLEGTPEQVTAMVMGVLARAEPFDKLTGQLEVLRQITPEQVEPVLAAYRADKAAGRTTEFETGLLYLRVGQLTGKTYLEPLMPKSDKAELSHFAAQAMEGWASVQPDKAYDWFRSWPRWTSRIALSKALHRGMAASDVAKAGKMVEMLDPELKKQLVTAHLSALANLKGRAAAVDWAEKQLLEPAPSVAALVQQDKEGKTAIVRRLVGMLGQNTAELRDVAARFAVGNVLARHDWEAIMKQLAWREQAETLDWMVKAPLIREREGINNPISIWSFTATWMEADAAGCAKWLDEQPDHPMRDFVAWTYAKALKKQNLEAARQLVGTMRDGTRRAAALEAINRPEPTDKKTP